MNFSFSKVEEVGGIEEVEGLGWEKSSLHSSFFFTFLASTMTTPAAERANQTPGKKGEMRRVPAFFLLFCFLSPFYC